MLTTHGGKGTGIYTKWRSMRNRCMNPGNNRWQYYGGRGITVCEEWKADFAAFRDWALSHGYVDGLTIDRIDNNGNYEPANCRWIPAAVQMRNMSHHKPVTAFGETKTLAEWTEDTRYRAGDIRTCWQRIHGLGWSAERAISQPLIPPGQVNAKLSEEDITTIRDLLRNGVMGKDIATRYGVNRSLISRIATGKIWSRVP